MYNANNYGYNPYGRYIPVQPMQQPVEPRNFLNGKQVESVDVARATDIPLDGSVSYFPLTDGSSIITKQLQLDGTSKITIFKPIDEHKIENRYITRDDLETALNRLNNDDIEGIREQIKDLKNEIKELKKKKKDE